MLGKVRPIARVGLFLLFAIVLVGLAPVVQTSVNGCTTKRSAPAENEIEHREAFKLRGTVTNRRGRCRPPNPRSLLPHELLGLRATAAPLTGPQRSGANKPAHPVVRWTHSPPSLQVFRR